MSKVKVSEDVFEAFKSTEHGGWYFEDKDKYLGYMFEYKAEKKFRKYAEPLNYVKNEIFLKALNNGYELELNPHEKVFKNYKKLKKEIDVSLDPDLKRELCSCIEIMKLTLDKLEVYIEGVNK